MRYPDEDIPIPVELGAVVRAYMIGAGRDDRGKTLWRVAFGMDGARRMEPVTEPMPWSKALPILRRLNARGVLAEPVAQELDE